MKYFVPSKTFLTGEYSVLVGGAALGLATLPSFEISYSDNQINANFHKLSPAGRYFEKKGQDINLQFYDPYVAKGIKGGFGKSTAEYLSVVIPDLKKNKKSLAQIHQDFMSLYQNEKVKPSGVDLLIQLLGKVAYVDVQQQKFESLDWNFKQLQFFVISTGLKIQTHDHLDTLDLKRLKDLPGVSDQVIQNYFKKSAENFIVSLNEWSRALKSLHLIHGDAVEFKEQILKVPGVIAAKACGALGADVLLAFCHSEESDEVEAQLRKRKIKIQAKSNELMEGLFNVVG